MTKGLGYWDTDHDGRFDPAEIDRWELDHGGYPYMRDDDDGNRDDSRDDDRDDDRPSSTSSESSSSGSWYSSYNDADDDADDYGEAPSGKEHCTRCLFWTRGSGPALRETGCGIWGYVVIECGDRGYDDNIESGSKHASCDLFEDDISPRPHCCDCGNWSSRSDSSTTSYGCRKWKKIEKLEEKTAGEFSVPDSPGDTVPALCPFFT